MIKADFKDRLPRRWWGPVIVVATSLAVAGCSQEKEDLAVQLPSTPAEAASRVEKVFAQAEPAAQETASAASDAVRTGDYEKAVVALESLTQRPSATLEQGLAVHGYLVTLEAQLVEALPVR